ncbi:FepA family TonB-dependent siderophore receptor [Orrella sp. 11846]|uniref:FepA family TonB-dependent siderophore receptor n=1 Tax=Orrella sp. 11846 TaxID=3409913 RepID=UPI003B599A9B
MRQKTVSILMPSVLSLMVSGAFAQVTEGEVPTLDSITVFGTAEQALLQAPGVSTINKEALEQRPPANDLAEIIRTMPGVNLTGNSASGAYGNNRQIDLRGMGPENTLILIDGKPVHSRDLVRMGRNGERNSRGDSNWVPAEAVERIEVLRGPAATRYGSGAAGGVVNIITKRPTDKLSGSVTVYQSIAEHKDEGDTRRLGFTLTGPLSERLSFRMFGNIAKTDPDSVTINRRAATGKVTPGGRDGVRNKDIDMLLRWDVTDGQVLELQGGYSRQGNLYAGDVLFGGNGKTQASLAGGETNTTYRRTVSLTHRGDYGDGKKSRLTFAYEGTSNSRLNEGLAGGYEGTISDPKAERSVSDLANYTVNGDFSMPFSLGEVHQFVTVGGEWRQESMYDPYSMTWARKQYDKGSNIFPTFSDKAKARSFALFVEDNIEVTENLYVTPGLRFDHHDQAGSNWSPSLNVSYYLTPDITIKGGIARAFKVPNLYQTNPSYAYLTRGKGCPDGIPGPCWILGNKGLSPETSVNKEIGIAYDRGGWTAGLTYFQNDYQNKIVTDLGLQGVPPRVDNAAVFQWVNSGRAVVKGLEGNLNIPLIGENGNTLKLINNFTYMIKNESVETGQPLSVIPRYTLNSTLDWQINEKWSAQAMATFYGKQTPRSRNPNANSANNALKGAALNVRGAYALFNLSVGYKYDENLSFRVGVNNLFDKRLYREGSQSINVGAATYNEPGRFYYMTMTASF